MKKKMANLHSNLYLEDDYEEELPTKKYRTQ